MGLGMPLLLAIFGKCTPGHYCNDNDYCDD